MVAIDTNAAPWPYELLPPRTIELVQDTPVILGPRPGWGAPQEVANDAGAWRIRLIDVPVYEGRILILRSILWRMATQGVACIVPVYDRFRSVKNQLDPVPFSDGSLFSDGSMFAGIPLYGRVEANASARASRVTISLPTGSQITGGVIIGIGQRSYGVFKMTANGANYDCDLWPILREDVVIGDVVELWNPVVKCRIDRGSADRAAQSLGALEYGVLGHVSIDFVEDW